MYNDDFAKSDVQISFLQLLSAAIIFIVVFIIPAGWFETQRLQTDSGPAPYTAEALAERTANTESISASDEGQVAGESTSSLTTTETVTSSNKFRIPLTAYYLDLQTNAGLLTIGGIALFGVGLSLVGFVIFSDKEPQRQEYLANYEFNNLERWN